jgi:putative NIF3 family GTP cyclohydrolase 1 type 2
VKAVEVMEHFRGVAGWVDWDTTCDRFLHGDPDIEVTGIATCWIATNACLRRAHEKGLNLFITHEPIFYDGYRGMPTRDRLVQEKKELLEQLGITVLRCHDVWDRMPEVGIVDAWAAHLGFETEDRVVESFYKVCLLGNELSVEKLAAHVREKVRPLGQEIVIVLGNREARVNRMAVGTGAITVLPMMYELDCDAILATDDGMNFWDGGLWARDIGIPLLLVSHCTAEKPGMQAMAVYLRDRFPDVIVEYLDAEFPYTVV